MSTAELPLVLVTVGTDHHRFDRLMDWTERWLAGNDHRARCVVQHGTSRPPAGAECYDMLSHEKLQLLMREAAAVVCQGGPGAITECRAAGRLPIVVPRTVTLGEHVDDHQMRFTQVLQRNGRAVRALTEQELAAHLVAALATPARYRVAEQDGTSAETIERFARLVDELVANRRRR